MIYAGIGARKTPKEFLTYMNVLGQFMASEGHTLRSGGATGADKAFEQGCDAQQGNKEIYLPWKGFNGNPSELYGTTREARILAGEFHPNWPNVGPTGRDFMGRNCYQVLGQDLETPTNFVICWTPNGKVIGGTGQALRMANYYEIPVLNFGHHSLEEIEEAINSLKG